MLLYASGLIGVPIISVQASGEIGAVQGVIVDPDTLKVMAFYVIGIQADPACNILDVKSIREHSQFGIVIDSEDELVAKDDVIKIGKVIDLGFSLAGLKVETRKKTKLGKVIDYTVTEGDYVVQQLIVKRPMIKSFLDSELVIPRREIVEINDYKVVVNDEEKTIREKAMTEDFIPNFVNPFRKTEPAHAKETER